MVDSKTSQQYDARNCGPAIILVRPQMAENVGAVARAMGNFDFADLRIVSPTATLPSDKAESMACKSRDILHEAKIYNSLSEALVGCDYCYALSARFRGRVNKVVYTPREAAEYIKSEEQHKSKIAFIFGAENNGLLNSELVLAQSIISIPTGKKHQALNIAQSACVLFYEIFINIYSDYKKLKHRHEKADAVDVDKMADMLDFKLGQSGFYKDEIRREAMILGIRNIFAKASLSKSEVKTLTGIFKYLYLYQDEKE